MEKDEYVLESFKNIQELIRFTDQKVAAILVLLGLEITFFLDITKDYVLTFTNIAIVDIVFFIFTIIFVSCVLMSIYIALILILKPGFASNYVGGKYSTFYFGHIAMNDKAKLISEIKKLSKKNCEQEIAEQIFEVTKILNRKNKFCTRLIWLTLFSIITLWIIILLGKI